MISRSSYQTHNLDSPALRADALYTLLQNLRFADGDLSRPTLDPLGLPDRVLVYSPFAS